MVWFRLGFVLYAIMFAAAGALAGRLEDAQSLTAPLSLLAVVGSLMPSTAPFMVPVRASLGELAVSEYGLSVVITIATIAVLTMVAGRRGPAAVRHSNQTWRCLELEPGWTRGSRGCVRSNQWATNISKSLSTERWPLSG